MKHFTQKLKKAYSMTNRWPVEAIIAYYDLPLEFLERAIHADPKIKIQGKDQGLVIDRFRLELFLQRKRLKGATFAALELGLTRDSFLNALAKNRARPPEYIKFPLRDFEIGDRYVFAMDLVEGWVKSRMPKHKAWSSIDSHAEELAKVLDAEVQYCKVSLDWGEKPPAVASNRCIVSWDFISIAHGEWLDNGKPMALHPDFVGWHKIKDGAVKPDELYLKGLERYNQYYAA